MKTRRLIVALIGVLLPGMVMAQTERLSLKECLNLALQHNQSLAISRYEEQVGAEKVRETRARALPQVNANANVTNNYKRQVMILPEGFGAGGPIEVGLAYGTAVNVDASQTLFDASVFTALNAAKAGEDYYKQSTKQSEEDVINQTAQTFYRLLALREQIRAQDSNIAKLTTIVEATQGQFDNGLARKIDLDRIKVNLTNAQTQRLQQQNQVAAQMAVLKRLIGLPAETNIEPDDISLRDVEQKAAAYVSPEDFDVEDRTEIQLVDAQIRLSDMQTKAIRAENYPKLNFFINYSYNGVTNSFNDYFSAGAAGTTWYGMGALGLRLNVPIFDGLARDARTKQSKIQGLELRKQREGVSLALKSNYENARTQISNSIQGVRKQQENVSLASQVYSSSQSNYNLGLATLTDLLEARTSFILAENSYIQALLDYKLAELEIIRSQGNLRSLLQ